MNYERAFANMVKLMAAEDAAFTALTGLGESLARKYNTGLGDPGLGYRLLPAELDAYSAADSGYQLARQKFAVFGSLLAGDPAFFDVLQPWMVDVRGHEEPLADAVLAAARNPDSAGIRAMLETSGELVKNVRAWLELEGYTIADSGGGTGGWHLGVVANDIQSRQLCTGLHKRFQGPIAANLLAVTRTFCGWRLPKTLPPPPRGFARLT